MKYMNIKYDEYSLLYTYCKYMYLIIRVTDCKNRYMYIQFFCSLLWIQNWNNNHKLQIPYVHDGKKYSTYKTLTIDAWNALLLKNIEKSSKMHTCNCPRKPLIFMFDWDVYIECSKLTDSTI